MVKSTGGNSGGWQIMDTERSPYNVGSEVLTADTSNSTQDDSYRYRDFLSNGFKLRNSDNNANQSGYTYIYLAFAEHPFKHTNAR
jgi:hypothetical protein